MIKTTPAWDFNDNIFHWFVDSGMALNSCFSDELLLLESYRLDPKTVRVQFNIMVFRDEEPEESAAFEQRTDCAYPLPARKNSMLRRKILSGFQKLRGQRMSIFSHEWDAAEYLNKTQIEIEDRRDVLFSNDKMFIEKAAMFAKQVRVCNPSLFMMADGVVGSIESHRTDSKYKNTITLDALIRNKILNASKKL